jgi:alpha-L-fucosidase
VTFARREGRYLQLEVTRAAADEAQVAFAELGVVTLGDA